MPWAVATPCRRCTATDRSHRFRDLAQLHLALEGRSQKRFFILVAITLAVMILLIVWLLSPWRPEPIVGTAF